MTLTTKRSMLCTIINQLLQMKYNFLKDGRSNSSVQGSIQVLFSALVL
jgi:hypothetical protein